MSLGQFLQGARESAGLSIDELAEITSIRVGLIKEIENNKFINCGGDTYARGHLRNIAAKISVDPQILIDLYNEEHSTESRKIHDMLVENNVTKIPTERKTVSPKSLAISSVVLLAAIGIGQIVISNSKTTVVPAISPSPTMAVTSSPSPTMAVTPSPSPTMAVTPSPSPTAVATQTVSPNPNAQLALTISAARGNSNIDVVVDGQHLYKGPMFQGDTKSFNAPTSISIYLSNAGDLDITLNNEKLAPLGARNQEIRKTFRSK